jgi:hypothetical protein
LRSRGAQLELGTALTLVDVGLHHAIATLFVGVGQGTVMLLGRR